jgi:hypothetical protein
LSTCIIIALSRGHVPCAESQIRCML